MLNRRK